MHANFYILAMIRHIHQLMSEYDEEEDGVPYYVKHTASNTRTYASSTADNELFSSASEDTYDAYEEDIATIHFYFESSAVFQYKRQAKMTFSDILSQVGGLLGLCLGFSLASLIEIVYWAGLRLWMGCKAHN